MSRTRRVTSRKSINPSWFWSFSNDRTGRFSILTWSAHFSFIGCRARYVTLSDKDFSFAIPKRHSTFDIVEFALNFLSKEERWNMYIYNFKAYVFFATLKPAIFDWRKSERCIKWVVLVSRTHLMFRLKSLVKVFVNIRHLFIVFYLKKATSVVEGIVSILWGYCMDLILRIVKSLIRPVPVNCRRDI